MIENRISELRRRSAVHKEEANTLVPACFSSSFSTSSSLYLCFRLRAKLASFSSPLNMVCSGLLGAALGEAPGLRVVEAVVQRLQPLHALALADAPRVAQLEETRGRVHM